MVDQFSIKTMNLDMQRLQQTRIIKVCQNDWFSCNYRPMWPPTTDWNFTYVTCHQSTE